MIVLVAIVLAWLLLPAGAAAQGLDQTCVLPLTKTDPATVNVAYPDEAAIYWSGTYAGVPGTRLKITGRYPHARYFSFNVYDAAQRPLDALADVEIAPDADAVNSFAAGAARTGEQRDYTAYVDFGPIPDARAPNTLYTGTGQNGAPNLAGTFILRVYVPDTGRDETGGVALPTVTLETTDGGRPPDSACAGLVKPTPPGINETIKDASGPPVPAELTAPGQNPPRWTKFRNLAQVANLLLTGNPFLDDFTPTVAMAEPAGGNGAFLSNLHNAYVFTAVNRAYGEVALSRFRAPRVPDTRPGPDTMPAAQLRYFSLCTNDTASQRFIACATDDQMAIAGGEAAVVTSSKASRPAWANADCGYTWLPTGPNASGSLILRHMLPDAGFAEAIQRAEPGAEEVTMGAFLPATRYVTDTPACRAAPITAGPPLGMPSPRRCVSRRHFTIRLARRLRSARVFVAGRRVAVRRGRRLRAPVDLRGVPRGTYRVRIVGRTRSGRTVRAVRTYRTCRTGVRG